MSKQRQSDEANHVCVVIVEDNSVTCCVGCIGGDNGVVCRSHVIACVNACVGIDPKVVPDLLEIVKAVANIRTYELAYDRLCADAKAVLVLAEETT